MKIVGLQGLSGGEVNSEFRRGARFVCFPYCISALVVTYRRTSPIYFIRAEGSAATKIAAYCGVSLLLGWWGVPWGPIWTVGSLVTNLRGGKDVTAQVVASMSKSSQQQAP